MVNDSEVKAQKSPFAMRNNERKVFDGKDGYVSINQVMFNVDMGYITDIHFEILEIINKYEFVTARQIFQLLLLKGTDIKSQSKVDDKLQKLIKTKVITRYYFTSEEGKGIFRVYCLEKMGKYLLASREIKSDWQQTNNAKPVHLIKKRLAGNQIIISYIEKVKAYESCNINAVLYSKKQNVKFKPTGGLIRLNDGKNIQELIFEVIRRNDDWENKLIEKMQLYADFYNFFLTKDCDFEKDPQLVIVAEDNQHISEIFKIIKKAAIPLKDTEMLFTTELKHLSTDLESSLIEFQYSQETNTYKGVVVNNDLLLLRENRIEMPKIEKKEKTEEEIAEALAEENDFEEEKLIEEKPKKEKKITVKKSKGDKELKPKGQIITPKKSTKKSKENVEKDEKPKKVKKVTSKTKKTTKKTTKKEDVE
ncbi:MAG: hypothetical protein PHH22_00765 [Clostridia bacterium]|nr:hypothetical protein [Clostridia bacterium]